jgi:flagellar basal-body rod protein FlgB
MGSQGLFSGTISTLVKGLDLRSMKHSIIVSNITNKDTPHYKAFDLAVEEEMKKIERDNGNIGIMKTNPGHLPGTSEASCNPEITTTKSSNGLSNRADGNTVDIESEMTSMAQNSLLYDAMTQLIHKKFQGMKLVIQGGGK